MPYITSDEIQKLIEVENHLGETENWSDATTKIWGVIENLVNRQAKERTKQKEYMREKRKANPQYGRKK